MCGFYLGGSFLSPNTHLVSCRQPSPGLVCSPVIVLSFGHLHVVTEADQNLSVSQLIYCGSLVELERTRSQAQHYLTSLPSDLRDDFRVNPNKCICVKLYLSV